MINPIYASIQFASRSVRETYSPKEILFWCERLWNDGENARKSASEDEEYMYKWSMVTLMGKYNLTNGENFACVGNYQAACNRNEINFIHGYQKVIKTLIKKISNSAN